MDNKVCFLFGHSTAPYEAKELVENAAEQYYLENGIRTFIVGNRGSFDSYATTAIKSLKKKYCDIILLLLLAYHPAERAVELSSGFDGSFYPPLEGVPRRYAIVRANRYMVDTADAVICYVCHGGNSGRLLDQARHRKLRDRITLTNVAEQSQTLQGSMTTSARAGGT